MKYKLLKDFVSYDGSYYAKGAIISSEDIRAEQIHSLEIFGFLKKVEKEKTPLGLYPNAFVFYDADKQELSFGQWKDGKLVDWRYFKVLDQH